MQLDRSASLTLWDLWRWPRRDSSHENEFQNRPPHRRGQTAGRRMKAEPIAPRLARIRLILGWLAIVALAAVEFGVGLSSATRIGQTTALQTEPPPPPNVGLDDLTLAATP